MILYRIVHRLVRTLTPLVADVRVEGTENVPAAGPFFLVLNHQSILDPILAETVCPRPVHSMTKSTQFGHPLFRWILPRLLTFPTRRYRVDPQAVRTALRLLGSGEGVALYPEGERSWDGTLQPFRRGSVRLLLKAGVAVVPCGIRGTYGIWPRWSRKIRRGRVEIRFGEPLHFGRHDDRAERETALPAATRTLREALIALGADGGPRSDAGSYAKPAPPSGSGPTSSASPDSHMPGDRGGDGGRRAGGGDGERAEAASDTVSDAASDAELSAPPSSSGG